MTGLSSKVQDRAHLDAAEARQWDSRGHLNRFTVILGFDQNETKQLLLGLGKGTVRHKNLSTSYPHGGRRPNGLESMGNYEASVRPKRVVVSQGVLREGIDRCFGYGVGVLRHWQAIFNAVD